MSDPTYRAMSEDPEIQAEFLGRPRVDRFVLAPPFTEAQKALLLRLMRARRFQIPESPNPLYRRP